MTSVSLPGTELLRDAEPAVFWSDRPGAPPTAAPPTVPTSCDLLIVGGGFTGLWAAIEARATHPDADIALADAQSIAFGASGRNGGFISESLTHGLAHGEQLWPDEMPQLLRMGRENLADIADFVAREGIQADLRLCGKTAVATTQHQLPGLAAAAELHRRYGEDATLQDTDAVRADVDSPTYLAGLRVRSGGGLVDPVALAWGLRRAAEARGVRIYENAPVRGLRRTRTGVDAATDRTVVSARQVLLATNAFPPLLQRLRHRVLPVYDHVLVTEPLPDTARSAIGWREEQGLTDMGNQFHYYRLTPDGRILWGGYDAVYYFGNRTDAWREQRDASHALLARQFLETFPQLEGLRFTHRWAGLIDSTSRFTPVFGTALDRRVAYSVGYTGLGVAASRFGARVALDLLDGASTERTRLSMVRRKPVPFPPEPLRYPTVQATRRALAREDRTGRRGPWLRLLDSIGVGFNS